MAKLPVFPISSTVMFSQYKAVGVRFLKFNELSDTQYTIFTDIKDLKEGDLVVADTQYGPSVAQVTQVDGLSKFDRDKASRLIISKINMKKVSKKYDKMKKLTELRAALQARREEMEDIAVLRLLAETDPKAKEMMDDLFKLTGDVTYQITDKKKEDTDGH